MCQSLYSTLQQIYSNATLRVFVARGDNSPFNGASIRVKFKNDTGNMQTDLLAYAKPIRSLNTPFDNTKPDILDGLTPFNNLPEKWHYADFQMNYDPCTCLFTSKIIVQVWFITSSQISLSGTATGSFTSISNGQGSMSNDRSFSLGDGFALGKKSLAFFKSMDDLVSKSKNSAQNAGISANNVTQITNAVESLKTASKTTNFLKTGLSFTPYLGTALSFLDMFVGGGKKSTGPQSVTLTPMAIDMSIKLQGTLDTNFPYNQIIFWNPGSDNKTKGPAKDPQYPYYNEVMGLFNVMEKPTVLKKQVRLLVPNVGFVTTQSFRVPNDIKYVVNPASGLEIQEIKVALFVEGNYIASGPGGYFNIFAGKDALTNLYQYRTEYVNLSCLKNNIFEIYASMGSGQTFWLPATNSNMHIGFMINFRRTDSVNDNSLTQNVLFYAKYPLNQSTVSNVGTRSTTGCGGVPPAQTIQAIQTFCNSNTYKAARFYSFLPQEGEEGKADQGKNEEIFVAFPNPTESYLSIKCKDEKTDNKILEIKIIDLFGREVYYSKEKSKAMVLNLSDLKTGTYYLYIVHEQGTEKKQIFIH